VFVSELEPERNKINPEIPVNKHHAIKAYGRDGVPFFGSFALSPGEVPLGPYKTRPQEKDDG
jgi:hypothetical protein